jgi:hypothetical protein
MTLERPCPTCGADLEYEQFSEKPITCTCGAELRSAHDCIYDPESQDSWCDDWLEEVTHA